MRRRRRRSGWPFVEAGRPPWGGRCEPPAAPAMLAPARASRPATRDLWRCVGGAAAPETRCRAAERPRRSTRVDCAPGRAA
eukprot:scaffold42919_cov42-Phaeocystis_antarctica.AAC.1